MCTIHCTKFSNFSSQIKQTKLPKPVSSLVPLPPPLLIELDVVFLFEPLDLEELPLACLEEALWPVNKKYSNEKTNYNCARCGIGLIFKVPSSNYALWERIKIKILSTFIYVTIS